MEDFENKQVGGSHYQIKIQPWQYIRENNLDFFIGNIIKYATRYSVKNNIQDIEKCAHYCSEIIKTHQYKSI